MTIENNIKKSKAHHPQIPRDNSIKKDWVKNIKGTLYINNSKRQHQYYK
jgi:hypothetical protein